MPDLSILLGNKNYSSWSLRPWMCLKQTGLPFSETVVPLFEQGYKETIRNWSPAGLVPVLKHGDLMIWESLAICEYLAELAPEAGLWPASREARAVARAASQEMHSGFKAVRSELPMNVRSRIPGVKLSPRARAEIERLTNLWRTCRQAFGADGPYLFGGFCIADAMFAPVVTRLVTYEVAMPDDLTAYMDTIMARSDLQEWIRAAAAEPWVVEDYERPAG